MGKLGRLLRNIRERRGWSVEETAHQAGISHSTLYRWEQDKYQPRLPELETVLNTLQASRETVEEALHCIEASRSVKGRRNHAVQVEGAQDRMPCVGDLWAALRLRAGLTQQQTADQLGVPYYTVSRWEAGTAVPQERLDALLNLYRAHPQERTYLLRHRRHLALPLGEHPNEEACRFYLADVRDQHMQQADFPAELCYLAIEAHLWTLASYRPWALSLLTYAWLLHADYLSLHHRLEEADAYAVQTLRVAERHYSPEPYWLDAANLHASYLARGKSRAGYAEGYRYLYSRANALDHFQEGSASFYRNLAEYARGSGEFVTARDWLRKSRAADSACEEGGLLIRLADTLEARVCVQTHALDRAFSLLRVDEDTLPTYRLKELLVWAEACLAANQRGEADDWLRRFYALLSKHDFPLLRSSGAALARRL